LPKGNNLNLSTADKGQFANQTPLQFSLKMETHIRYAKP